MKGCKLLVFLTVLCVLFAWEARKKAVASEKKLSKVLNVYNWEDYFGPTTLSDFEKKFGVKVNLEIFKDEEEMVSSLQSHPEKYDIIITSGDEIRALVKMRLLAEIDLKNIPNLKNIEQRFRDPHYDPGHRHSVPYLWGTTGIVVNRTFIKDKEDGWSILWNSKYKGKIAMLNNPEEVIGATLKYLGYSVNTNDPSKLDEARQKLFDQSPLLAGYLDCITLRAKLISNELWAAQIYSGEGMFAVDKNEALEYIIPKEGTSMWVDCMAIPRDAEHKYTAEVFINYVLNPEVSAEIANYLWYANCNQAARANTQEEILKSPSLYPSKEILKKCEFFQPVGTAEEEKRARQIFNRIWSELRLKKGQKNLRKDDL
ncbi:MAG: spermidine/putrescine ABC transporter substrate-binding protein [Pseudomonadota bacterium]